MKNKLNRNVAKVVSALISNGYYSFKINKKEDHCDIDIMELVISPYTFMRVYDDVVHYYNGEGLRFEGSTKRQASIIKDILNK